MALEAEWRGSLFLLGQADRRPAARAVGRLPRAL